jgi:hypothetical protein
MELPESSWRNTPFLATMRAQGVALRVHLLNDDEALKTAAYDLIKPCVEDFYQRCDFAPEMLDAAYFVMTLSKAPVALEIDGVSCNDTARLQESLSPSDVMGCLVGFWLPFPENAVEVRFECVRTELQGHAGSEEMFQCYNGMLLTGLQWTVHYLARNDPFIMLNLGGGRMVDVRVYMDLYDRGHNVWSQALLEEMEYEHVQDSRGERQMEKHLVFQ